MEDNCYYYESYLVLTCNLLISSTAPLHTNESHSIEYLNSDDLYQNHIKDNSLHSI